MPGGPRAWAHAAVLPQGTGLVVFGGCNGDPGAGELNIAERWDSEGEVWELLPPMADRRSGAAVAVVGGWVYACGGCAGSVYLKAVERLGLTPASGAGSRWQWQTVPAMSTPRADSAVVVAGGCLYVCGGESGHGPPLSSVERFDPEAMCWESLPEMTEAKAGAAAAAVAGKLYIFGGFNEQALDSVEYLDLTRVNYLGAKSSTSTKPVSSSCGNDEQGTATGGHSNMMTGRDNPNSSSSIKINTGSNFASVNIGNSNQITKSINSDKGAGTSVAVETGTDGGAVWQRLPPMPGGKRAGGSAFARIP
ncbi:unnamed protein product [Polarella glacialis]|uniref:Uncharacterized protein n=1 Tax=Polarella glacialis TaxID=89957 RepID=A0A813FVC9_POLGL|nr:unnamed protein product [Polarella glacialis]